MKIITIIALPKHPNQCSVSLISIGMDKTVKLFDWRGAIKKMELNYYFYYHLSNIQHIQHIPIFVDIIFTIEWKSLIHSKYVVLIHYIPFYSFPFVRLSCNLFGNFNISMYALNIYLESRSKTFMFKLKSENVSDMKLT